MYESLQMQYEELYLFLKENSRKSKVSSHYCSPQLRTCTTQREGSGDLQEWIGRGFGVLSGLGVTLERRLDRVGGTLRREMYRNEIWRIDSVSLLLHGLHDVKNPTLNLT